LRSVRASEKLNVFQNAGGREARSGYLDLVNMRRAPQLRKHVNFEATPLDSGWG